MALVESELQVGDEPLEQTRRKTPLWLLGAGAALLLAIIFIGFKREMKTDVTPVKELTQRGASVEGSSMARLLDQQRREAQEQERAAMLARAQAPSAPTTVGREGQHATGDGNERASVGSAAYVAPTSAVPKYAFAGGEGDCDALATLAERMKCLDGEFVYETRKVHMKELGDTLTSDDNLFMVDDGQQGSEGPGTVPRQSSRDWTGLGSPTSFGDIAQLAPRAAASEPSRDTNVEFHRTGGAEVDPDRKVGEQVAPPSRFWLRSGSILPCSFISGVTSQLPGQVEAQITHNVYDSIDQRHLLIPAGSMLVGRPNPVTRQGQDRIQFAWTELHLPDGEFRELGGMAGADGAGMAGVEGKVNRHWGQKLGIALMSTSINVSYHLAAPQSTPGTPQDAVARGVGEGVVQVANENLRKMMEIPDEIIIKPAQTCSVKVERSMEFPRAYSDGKRWRR